MSSSVPEAPRADNRAGRPSSSADGAAPDGKTTDFAAQFAGLIDQTSAAGDSATTTGTAPAPAATPAQPAPRPSVKTAPPEAEFALIVAGAEGDSASANPPTDAQIAPVAAPIPAKDAKAETSAGDAPPNEPDGSTPTTGDSAPSTAIDPAIIVQVAAPAVAAAPAAPSQQAAVDPDAASDIAITADGAPRARPPIGATAPGKDASAAATTEETAAKEAGASGQAPSPQTGSPDQAVDGKTASPPSLSPAAAKGALGDKPADEKAGETKDAAAAPAETKPTTEASARSETPPKRSAESEPERAEARSDVPAHARAATAENALQPLDSATTPSGPAPQHQPAVATPALPDAARAQTPQQPATPLPMAPIAIGLQAMNGAREFQIRLDPDDLGRVDVKLTIGEDGRVAASLTVDRVDTLALLQRDARTLERAFDQAGFTADSDSLKFSLRQDQTGQQQQGGEQRNATPTPTMRQIQIEAPVETSVPQWRAPTPIGGVDIRI